MTPVYLNGNRMIPEETRRNLSLLFTLAFLFFSCAGAPEVSSPHIPDAPEPVRKESPAELSIYFPLETAALADIGRTGSMEDSLVVLRFDRPGAWSIYPERFLFFNGVPQSLEPVQIFGSSKLRHIDMILLRTEPQRPAGFLEGRWGKDFFSEDYTQFPLPEALLFLDRSWVKDPLALNIPKDSAVYKRGMQNFPDLPSEIRDVLADLDPGAGKIIDDVLRLGSAGGSRRGFRSLMILPFDALPYEADGTCGEGMELEFTFNLDPGSESISSLLTVTLLGNHPGKGDDGKKVPGSEWIEEVRIGDLGVFSGATPLLDPDIPRVAGEVYQSGILSRIGSSRVLRPSPVLWEGSFNAYRDERRKFLFSPGIFSYIPGKHPDLSSEDVRKVTGMEQHEFDRLLQGRPIVTLQHAIYGVIPAFIAASSSPTELEIAFSNNQRLRESLGEFLRQKARLIWLD